MKYLKAVFLIPKHPMSFKNREKALLSVRKSTNLREFRKKKRQLLNIVWFHNWSAAAFYLFCYCFYGYFLRLFWMANRQLVQSFATNKSTMIAVGTSLISINNNRYNFLIRKLLISIKWILSKWKSTHYKHMIDVMKMNVLWFKNMNTNGVIYGSHAIDLVLRNFN